MAERAVYLAHISVSFLSPLAAPLPAISIHSQKPVPMLAMHLTFQFMALPDPLATRRLPYSDRIMSLRTDFSYQDPQILLAPVFFVFWKMNSSLVGEDESNLYLHSSLPCIRVQVGYHFLLLIRGTLLLWHMGQGCMGCCCVRFKFLLASGIPGVPWLSVAWFPVGLDQSYLCINKGHFIDRLLIPCLHYCDPTPYFQ